LAAIDNNHSSSSSYEEDTDEEWEEERRKQQATFEKDQVVLTFNSKYFIQTQLVSSSQNI